MYVVATIKTINPDLEKRANLPTRFVYLLKLYKMSPFAHKLHYKC
jgi:hypothetical protein